MGDVCHAIHEQRHCERNCPGAWLEITAEAQTDFFIDTSAGIAKNNAPFACTEVSGDFVISACIEPDFRTVYDAGGIFVYENDTRWIKHEFEMTDLGYQSIVSVITDGASDDSNGEKMEGVQKVYLQVVRKGDYWALHHSLDGKEWKMARYFRMEMPGTLKVGFEAQSPVGGGTTVRFSDIISRPGSVVHMRKGV